MLRKEVIKIIKKKWHPEVVKLWIWANTKPKKK